MTLKKHIASLESVNKTVGKLPGHTDDNFQSSWLNKGYALGEGLCHASTKQEIESVLSEINSICEAGANEKDITVKLNLLFHALGEFARAFQRMSELSTNNIRVSLVAALIADDVQKGAAATSDKINQDQVL